MGGRRQSIHSSAGTVTVVSSILWNDATIDESKQHIVADEDGTYILYCNINGDNPGIGNITADPMVVDAVNGDFRLQEGSPCIDMSGILQRLPHRLTSPETTGYPGAMSTWEPMSMRFRSPENGDR